MAKSANLYSRIEPEIKEQAEKILKELGISPSSAITMFYKQIIIQKGLPFKVSLFDIEKQKLIDENEAKYGEELRTRFGDKVIDESNKKLNEMNEKEMNDKDKLSEMINSTLKDAFATGDPAGELAQKTCEYHKKWLCMMWPDGAYSKQAHLALAEGYLADPRFTAYYDKIAPGCTKFLRDALAVYCAE